LEVPKSHALPHLDRQEVARVVFRHHRQPQGSTVSSLVLSKVHARHRVRPRRTTKHDLASAHACTPALHEHQQAARPRWTFHRLRTARLTALRKQFRKVTTTAARVR